MARDFLIFGDHHEYPGDNPWWTLRFREEPSAAQKKVVEDFVMHQMAIRSVADLLTIDDWEGRQVQLSGPEGGFDDEAEWSQFYRGMDRFFDALHQKVALFAVMLQEGQFHDGEELVDHSDEQLQSLVQPEKRKR